MKKFWFLVLAAMMCISSTWAGVLEDGVAAFNAKRYDHALPLLQQSADSGTAQAQGLLARMHFNGLGVTKDRAVAIKWARLAANQGDAVGQNILGASYRHGDGVPRDYKEAIKWHRLAADQITDFRKVICVVYIGAVRHDINFDVTLFLKLPSEKKKLDFLCNLIA